jgi:hypothetical protein
MTKKSEKRKPKIEAPKEPATKEKQPGPADLKAIRQQIRDMVGDEAVGMVSETIHDERRGYLGTKYLFEMAGIFPVGMAEEDSDENALARILLRRLGLKEAIGSTSEATKSGNGGEAAKVADTVK